MGKRSFQASREGVERLTQAFDKYGKTQDCLAREVGCTRQTVNKFLMKKPISKELFKSLCDKLNLEWEDVAELNADHENENSDHKNENFNTVPVMNETPNNIIENIPGQNTSGEVGLITPIKKPDEFKTCITYNTINGQFIITIPGDINSFLKNRKKQNNLLNALRILSSDENATISNIEKGSIKITFNVSSDGIKKLEEEPDKIILVARIICRSEGEELDLSDTDLSHVDLSGLDLSGINFSCADLRDANLENANLENADLDCADLSGANLRGANLKGTSLNDSILNDSIIDDKWLTVWKIVNQSFLGRNLIGANLSNANLRGANLSKADLMRADLSGANLIFANLIFANLRRANLIFANLSGTNLSGTNLIGANLIFANLIFANLSGANLIGANLTGTALVFANVGNAHFGSNPGIYEDAKRELKQRGAIFEDSPGDDSKVSNTKVPTR